VIWRALALVAIAGVAFAVTRYGFVKPSRSSSVEPSPSSSQAVGEPSGPEAETTAPKPRAEVRVLTRPEQLTAWQRELVRDREAAGMTQAIIREHAREQMSGAHPSACLAEHGAVGEHHLRFETTARVTADRAEISAWRLAEIVEGTSLPDEAVRCMEDLLGPAAVIESPPGARMLDSYEGPITIEFRASIAPAE
jgi:hypothetical protein